MQKSLFVQICDKFNFCIDGHPNTITNHHCHCYMSSLCIIIFSLSPGLWQVQLLRRRAPEHNHLSWWAHLWPCQGPVCLQWPNQQVVLVKIIVVVIVMYIREGCTSGDLFQFRCPDASVQSVHEHSRHPDPNGNVVVIYHLTLVSMLYLSFFLLVQKDGCMMIFDQIHRNTVSMALP